MTNGRILYYRPTGKTYAKTESNLGMRVSSAAHCAALNSLLVAVKGLLLILPFDQQQKAKKVQTDFQDIQRMFVWKDVLFVVESLNMYKIALSDLTASKSSARIQRASLPVQRLHLASADDCADPGKM